MNKFELGNIIGEIYGNNRLAQVKKISVPHSFYCAHRYFSAAESKNQFPNVCCLENTLLDSILERLVFQSKMSLQHVQESEQKGWWKIRIIVDEI